jgi:DNA/RNA endonuclease YhcR with UshA esterase domain
MKKSIKPLAYFVVFVLGLLIWASHIIAQQESINPIDAQKYVGMEKTVCGMVANATYASQAKGEPTFLNLDQPFPRQIFTAIIWGDDRSKFKEPPELFFKGKRICVTGMIERYRGTPAIIVRRPGQIVVKPQ